jgi:hypothetical protein
VRLLDLCVPKTSSESCDQAIFVDQGTGVSQFSDAVLVEIDRLGKRFQRRGCVQGAVRPVLVVVSLVISTLLLPDYRATSVPDLLAALWVRAPGSRRRQMRPVRAGTAMTAPNPETEARISDAALTAAGRRGVRRLTVGSVCAQARYHRPLQGRGGAPA